MILPSTNTKNQSTKENPLHRRKKNGRMRRRKKQSAKKHTKKTSAKKRKKLRCPRGRCAAPAFGELLGNERSTPPQAQHIRIHILCRSQGVQHAADLVHHGVPL